MATRSGSLVLGIDAGTGGVRAGLYDLTGQALGAAEAGYATAYPRPGWAEQQAEDWWRALVAAVRGCLATARADPARVVGLAIDAPCNLLLVDERGAPLGPSPIWMDLRAADEARRLTATGAPALRACGGEEPAEWPLPKAWWLRDHQPTTWARASRLVEQMTWLTWRLTGEWVAPLNSAAAKWHYRAAADDSAPAGWPLDLLSPAGLTDLVERLPATVLPMGGRAGGLLPAAAEALGLPAGIAVAMSGIDAHAGMVGLGVLAPGAVALITGTSTCQLAQAAQPVVDPGLWGPFGGAVVAGAWTLEAGQASTGGTVRWLLDLLGGDLPTGPARYTAADAAAAAVPPGAEGLTVLDFWQGSRTPIKDPAARGTIWGLTHAHGPGHLLRAVYEATAYGNRHILATLTGLGVPTGRLIACGGGTRSRLWLQILADVAGVPIQLPAVADAVGLGSAVCAAAGAGAFPDLASAARAMVRLAETIEPNPSLVPVYAEGYARYRATYAALAPLFRVPSSE